MLPVESYLPQINESLKRQRTLLLEAAPGAGKSTRIPLTLMDQDWLLDRKILLLEPRRVAAQSLAYFLAEQRGEPLGKSVGLEIREARRVSADSRLIVMTNGVFLRRLQNDPELGNVGAVLFDEFHERQMASDLGLTLLLDAKSALRPDLALLLMSATMDSERVARFLDCEILRVEGREYPVETRYRPSVRQRGLPVHTAAVAAEALQENPQGVLVFLPGVREIEQTRDLLSDHDPMMLHGSLKLEQQRAALSEHRHGRVILATNIAESSLTVPGIDCVIDSGLERRPALDIRSGFTHLITSRIPQDSADQRRGRAGRLGPGLCYRLWDATLRLEAHQPPEVTESETTDLLLEIALWGSQWDQLRWLDKPGDGSMAQARAILRWLGALDDEARLTSLGRRIAGQGTQARLAAMIEEVDDRALVADITGLLERGVRSRSDRLSAQFDKRRNPAQSFWRKRLGVGRDTPPDASRCGQALTYAYPDRIARQREGSSRYLMANGKGARLHPQSDLTGTPWLVIADAKYEAGDVVIRCAEPLSESEVRRRTKGLLEQVPVCAWDPDTDGVVACRQTRFGAIVVQESVVEPPAEEAQRLLEEQIQQRGVPLGSDVLTLCRRMDIARSVDPSLPDLSPQWLADHIGEWLVPHLAGAKRWSAVEKVNQTEAVIALLTWDQRQTLNRLAPTQVKIPSGRSANLDYTPTGPVLAVKLQEMFGCKDSPRVGNGIPVTLHLLSPAGRPLQVTQDLGNFWNKAYVEVRKEMRGRYPKHPWPEDPASAQPTAKTKRALARDS